MILRCLKIILLALFCGLFWCCGDDDSSEEFHLDREISDFSAQRYCAPDADSGAYCFHVKFRYPIETEHLSAIYLWVNDDVVGDTAKNVSDDQLSKATAKFDFHKTDSLYMVIDVTPYIQDYAKELDSVMVAVYCTYNDDTKPGAVQRIYLHFADDMPPSLVALYDSVWTTGALFEWDRPTDQTDYYASTDMAGPILGYNIVIYSADKDEDLRDLMVRVYAAGELDADGSKFYSRHMRIRSNNDSVWVDSVSHDDSKKNYLHIAILDGKGYNTEDPSQNLFRVIIDGLKAQHEYTIGISSWDSSGNASGSEVTSSVTTNQLFITTDSIPPVISQKIFTIKDTLFPELARLDSNNRLRIFWSRSVDPLIRNHGIGIDSVLTIPDTCLPKVCYDTVPNYVIEYYDAQEKGWILYSYAGGGFDRYRASYEMEGDSMVQVVNGSFVTDTIRWVAPGDTLILRIRAKDRSGYYSRALIDTVYVSPGPLARDMTCPEGFVAVAASDTNVFCMERYEHRNDSGEFVSNVLHSEALSACEGISASGFTVSLCNERDWELVCLSGGTLSYGVIEEETSNASEYLFANCNVGTNDSAAALSMSNRNDRCKNPAGVHDMPGQLQEWVMGRSEDTVAVTKGGSYKIFGGLGRETQALCTNRSFPFYTRPAYTTDTVYLYREGTKVDTVYQADTNRTLYATIPSRGGNDPLKLSFKDSLQFFDVQDSAGNSVGTDYTLYSEYKKGGDAWLDSLGNGLKYVPDHVEVVFLTGEKVSYRKAAAFYKSPAIGFRCCAYPSK